MLPCIAGSSGASTGTGLAGDLLPFMIDDGEDGGSSTGASRPVPVSGGGGNHGAPLLMSSTRLDALIGPLTPSVTDSERPLRLSGRPMLSPEKLQIFSCPKVSETQAVWSIAEKLG